VAKSFVPSRSYSHKSVRLLGAEATAHPEYGVVPDHIYSFHGSFENVPEPATVPVGDVVPLNDFKLQVLDQPRASHHACVGPSGQLAM
jgi:hypothetical protein